jgi:hypothetical protein
MFTVDAPHFHMLRAVARKLWPSSHLRAQAVTWMLVGEWCVSGESDDMKVTDP